MNGNTLDGLFLERKKFVLIGLTGRTGSGCTTAATILETKKNKQIFPSSTEVSVASGGIYEGLDLRRYEILSSYAKENWSEFVSIKISDLISAYLILLSKKDVLEFIWKSSHKSKVTKSSIEKSLDRIIENNKRMSGYKDLLNQLLGFTGGLDPKSLKEEEFLRFLVLVRKFTRDLKRELCNLDEGLYVSAYQRAGNSIRKTGRVSVGYEDEDFNKEAIFTLPETINRIVKCLREIKDTCYIVIDAIRNPYEARFFKDRYSAFYLLSVNTSGSARSKYLHEVHKFDPDQRAVLDQTESGKLVKDGEVVSPGNWGERITITDVKKCLQVSDIHVYNPRSELSNTNVIRAQLFWYFSLMLHPGLVSPTAMERVMQIAFTAKANSGCISRQVGAVVTGDDFSIRAVGWNDVPAGQVPCGLRTVQGALSSFDSVVYSNYERNDDGFRSVLKRNNEKLIANINVLGGRPLSYCFKDNQNDYKKDRNQVHTRSLHAEENAFLQISKYGGSPVKGGKLFTTASPCELCSKKAVQIGVEEVVFIDPYPGISSEHVLSNGLHQPKLVQFRGGVGSGYHRLYEPLMPFKDELSYLDSLTL